MGGSALGDKTLQQIMSPFQVPQKEAIPFVLGRPKIIIIAGPTGVGKTELSLQIARLIGGEIISADSMQVYRGMDIGTAKVKPEERGSIRHHLIDSRDVDEAFNVVDFYHEATQAFREIFARQHVPIVVGGTGFYIQALIYGPPGGPASVPEVRSLLEKEMDQKGALTLYEQLKALDPDYAASITFRDRQKIIRGLEIMHLTRQKVSSFKNERVSSETYNFRPWFLYKPKEVLYPILDERCEAMIREGFIEEVKQLEKEGLRSNTSASQAIGYRQCLDYLQSGQTPDDLHHFLQAFKQATRRYAKRQFTWFRKEELFRWLNAQMLTQEILVETIIQDYEQSF
jgi:tRNA dimethylallyltransferase